MENSHHHLKTDSTDSESSDSNEYYKIEQMLDEMKTQGHAHDYQLAKLSKQPDTHEKSKKLASIKTQTALIGEKLVLTKTALKIRKDRKEEENICTRCKKRFAPQQSNSIQQTYALRSLEDKPQQT